ncbi:MAG: radical SAM protein [Melioribacteraceae bacterium]|nr:radical SAM protein [Melioribacteraceae bacterium]
MDNSKYSFQQDYDVWLQWNVTSVCNLQCEYCFSPAHRNKLVPFLINIKELLSTLKKSEKTFRIGFTGGEPFLVPNFIEACKEITKCHFISVNTNLILNKISEFVNEIDPARVLFIHASLHYEELIKKNLLEKFHKNYQLLKEAGFNIYAEGVAYPGLANMIGEIKHFVESNKIKFEFASFYGKYNNKDYPESYTDEEVNKFNLDEHELKKYNQDNRICNAGCNAAVVFANGNVKSCFQIKDDLGNIYNEIKFKSDTIICSFKKCGCPLNEYDQNLLNKSKS